MIAADDDGPIPGNCPVCDGVEDGSPCSEECDELILRAKTRKMICGAYDAAVNACFLARLYRAEGGTTDHRYRACLDQVGAYRRFVRSLRTMLSLQAEDMAMADTQPAPAADEAAQ